MIPNERIEAWLAMPLETLCALANDVRYQNQRRVFDFCAIVSAKTGICSEDCKFCAQSCTTKTEKAQWLSTEAIVEEAGKMNDQGVMRFSLVATGRKISSKELENAIETIRCVKATYPELKLCVSFGLLELSDFIKLKEAGVERVHNNLETSERYFKEVCSTHTYQDKIQSIKAAQQAGLEVCSGLLMGMGETMEDRIDVFKTLKTLNIKSIPMNFLIPIEGTKLASQPLLSEEEMLRTIAIARLINEDAYIRLAGGRKLFSDFGARCFESGANATITGDLLTTTGVSTSMDIEMVTALGFEF